MDGAGRTIKFVCGVSGVVGGRGAKKMGDELIDHKKNAPVVELFVEGGAPGLLVGKTYTTRYFRDIVLQETLR